MKEPQNGSDNKPLPAKHKILLKENSKDVYCRPYRRSCVENQLIKSEVEKLISLGFAGESDSNFASPVVLAKKKKGEFRYCIDYRRLNGITIIQPFPIPHIEELLDTVGSARYYSALDLEFGYHQVSIDEKFIPKTAFITKDGHYEWLRMPFGLVNALFTFQKTMNIIFKEYLWRFVIIYLDDILIFSSTIEKHREHVKAVFNKIKQYGLKINIKKCSFGVSEIEFLGHRIIEGKILVGSRPPTPFLSFN